MPPPLRAPLTPLRPPAESLYADELLALSHADTSPRPTSWRLSPRAVQTFILGSSGERLPNPAGGDPIEITRKFVGNDALVQRCIVTLDSDCALMLVGEPGTAKSMLSELLAAAICGTSLLTIQGSAATTEESIHYSWNYALLLAKGPVPEALVPSPLFAAMRKGALCRFEELTRTPQEVQDTLISTLSSKVLHVHELPDDQGHVFAQEGFNVIATSNLRDRGVNEMSAALGRRFNFETVGAIADIDQEVDLVATQAAKLLARKKYPTTLPRDVVELLVTTFQELRKGESRDGVRLDRPTTALSTAEAVGIVHASALHAIHFSGRPLAPEDLVRYLPGAVAKDAREDMPRLVAYFDLVVRDRAKRDGGVWSSYDRAGEALRGAAGARG